MRVDPAQPRWAQRDRFILSKGHCSGAFYSTLAASGFFPVEQLKTLMDPLPMLNGHPDRNKLPGVEANTGPLGHGLPFGVGAALGARMRQGVSFAENEPAWHHGVPTREQLAAAAELGVAVM
jgi:transketolase